MIDRPDLVDDPGLGTTQGQRDPANLEWFLVIWYPWIAERSKH
jgi:hypothetical protein